MKNQKVIQRTVKVEELPVDFMGRSLKDIVNQMQEIIAKYPQYDCTYLTWTEHQEYGDEYTVQQVVVTRKETVEEAVARTELDHKKELEWTLNTMEHLKDKLKQLEASLNE